MITDVVDTAWEAIGSPVVEPSSMTSGVCARCGRVAELVSSAKAVSKFYRSWDVWRDPNGAGVCPACMWSFHAPLLRSVPHWIHRDPSMLVALSPADLAGRLQLPLGTDSAIVLPLRPGRRHLIHHAQWGTVTTDDGALAWTSGDARRLGDYQRLRALGLSHQQVMAPVPPFALLRKLDSVQAAEVLDVWPALDSWRACPAWAAIASRTLTTQGVAA